MDSGVQVISITYKKSSFCHTNFEFRILSYLLYCNSPYLTSRHTFMWNKYIDKNISYYYVPIRSSEILVNFNFNIFLRTSRSVMLIFKPQLKKFLEKWPFDFQSILEM